METCRLNKSYKAYVTAAQNTERLKFFSTKFGGKRATLLLIPLVVLIHFCVHLIIINVLSVDINNDVFPLHANTQNGRVDIVFLYEDHLSLD